MKSLSVASSGLGESRRKPSGIDQVARRAVRSRLGQICDGQVVVSENGRHESFGRLTKGMPLTTLLTIHDPRFHAEVAFGGAIGAAEAWMHGYWSCDELVNLVRILLRNRHVLDGMNRGTALVTWPLRAVAHRLNRNTRSGSRRNIAAHYDLGNEFYALWLDRTMMYSSAVFERPDMTLEEASVAKLDRICRKLRLSAADRVLEIGTGWGGFAVHAAMHYDCHVTTTTISRRQYEFVADRIRRAGLGKRIELLLCDYRDLQGSFDKLVSVEMIEAVGWEYQRRFLEKCSELLLPHGEMLLQSITIADQNFDAYRNRVDFIRRHVFPGGCLTSVTAMLDLLTRATDLRVVHLEDIGPHYARTLQHWRVRFEAALERIRALGYGDEFIRKWQYYFCYCEGAFLERVIGDVQMYLVKPRASADVVDF